MISVQKVLRESTAKRLAQKTEFIVFLTDCVFMYQLWNALPAPQKQQQQQHQQQKPKQLANTSQMQNLHIFIHFIILP